jgi:hypothetical protein
LYLAPEPEPADPDARVVEADSADADLGEAFDEAVRIIVAALESGAFFPRLESDKASEQPSWCRYCEVGQACIRGDTAQRRHLTEWMNASRPEDLGEADDVLSAAARLWWLGR